MTLKRLAIILAILIFLAGVGIAWLWNYAYAPQGRARVIIAQLKNDNTSLRGWMLEHRAIRQGYPYSLQDATARATAEIKHEMEEDARFPQPQMVDVEKLLKARLALSRQTAAGDEMVKIGRGALPVVIEALRDSNRDVQMMTIRFCGKVPDPAEIPPLAQCMRDATRNRPKPNYNAQRDSDYETQYCCLQSLIEIGPEAYGPLIDASKECDPEVRLGIPRSMVRKSGIAALPYLIRLLEDSYGDIRASAAFELGTLKDKRATDALIRNLGDSETYPAKSAAKALGDIGDRKSIPALLNAIRDKRVKNAVRIPAAGSLARMGQDEGLKFILAMIKSRSSDDRSDAADALGFPAIHGTLGPLLSLLGDRDWGVRASAVCAIGEHHDAGAIPALRKLLNDPDFTVRNNAAEVLKELGDKPPPASQPAKP